MQLIRASIDILRLTRLQKDLLEPSNAESCSAIEQHRLINQELIALKRRVSCKCSAPYTMPRRNSPRPRNPQPRVGGRHKVLKVQRELRITATTDGPDDNRKYRCWSCSKVIISRQQFIKHVLSRYHCGVGPGSIPPRKLTLRIWPFPFLRLPAELHLMGYEYFLCFQKVEMLEVKTAYWGPPRRIPNNGIPLPNPLAIMLVNRQIYREARHMFYSQNAFYFTYLYTLSLFLMRIGFDSAQCLRSIYLRNSLFAYKEYSEEVKTCIRNLGMPNINALHISLLPVWGDVEEFLADGYKISDLADRYPHTIVALVTIKGRGSDRVWSGSYRL